LKLKAKKIAPRSDRLAETPPTQRHAGEVAVNLNRLTVEVAEMERIASMVSGIGEFISLQGRKAECPA
jgi:hypothetical protein